jgi:metallophosphoesterase superfamily enzyme
MHDPVRRWLATRRHVLHTGIAGFRGAALAALALPACSSSDNDEGPLGDGTSDAGADDTTPAIDVSHDADPGVDTGATDADVTDATTTDTVPADVAEPVPPEAPFRIAIVADTHVIDEHYDGQESNELDTSSLYLAEERLNSVVDRINRLDPRPDHVFNLGDIVHDAEWTDWDYYFENRTRIDRAFDAHQRLQMPWHGCFGNHDYRIGRLTAQFTEELFLAKMGMQPWKAVDHKGWKFLLLNNFQGYTQDASDPRYQRGRGTFGEEQLQWLEAQLAEGKPTFVFNHYMLGLCEDREFGDFSLHSLLRRHADTIENVITGHTHRWLDFRNQFGPKHMVMGATRYDEDCFILIEIDPATDRVTYVNQPQWGMFSMFAEPYEGS